MDRLSTTSAPRCSDSSERTYSFYSNRDGLQYILCLPGEFFTPSPQPPVEPTDYVSRMSRMQQLCAPPPRPRNRRSYIDKTLSTCTHVFLRCDTVCKPLQPPYDGPYLVVECSDKYFTIDSRGCKDTVSLDRLKPVHLDSLDDNSPTP